MFIATRIAIQVAWVHDDESTDLDWIYLEPPEGTDVSQLVDLIDRGTTPTEGPAAAAGPNRPGRQPVITEGRAAARPQAPDISEARRARPSGGAAAPQGASNE